MFQVGDKVKAKGNYRDEQLGEFAPYDIQTIVEVKEVTLAGTSGQWVKTDIEHDWVDSAWFESGITQHALDRATCPAHGEPVSNLIHFACGCSQEPPRN